MNSDLALTWLLNVVHVVRVLTIISLKLVHCLKMNSTKSAAASQRKNIKVTCFNNKVVIIQVCKMQVTVEYDTIPPQVWLSNLRRVATNCKDFHVQVQFIEVPRVEPLLLSTAGLGTCIPCISMYIHL